MVYRMEKEDQHMTLNTHPADRKEMVQAISAQMQLPAIYLRTPSYAYQIGAVTVNRDGGIDCDDAALLNSLKPMLIEHGWLAKTNAVDSEADAASLELSFPVEDWTVPQLNNLLRTLYSNQYILRRMMLSDALYIDRQLVERLSEVPMEAPADFEALLADGLATGLIKGCCIQDGRFTLEAIKDDRDPARWQVYATLLSAILEHAKAAKRVFLRADADPENEKYCGNSFLMRLGFGGPEHKPLRRVLLGHLNGYAAFRSAADMQAHREKYAQLRRKQREEARP